MKQTIFGCSTVVFSLLFSDMAAANEWKFEPGVRWRYQQVDDQVRGNGTAHTVKLRAKLNWQAPEYWSAVLELDSVHELNRGEFNSVTVNDASTPIPDPEGTRFNQLMLQYQSDDDWSARIGRQTITFDQGRHIGGNEFWQHEHSFDAMRLTYQDNLKWQFDYVYVDAAQRIFGPKANSQLSVRDVRFPELQERPVNERGRHDHQSHLMQLQYDFGRAASIGGYYYLLDNQTQVNASTKTFGGFVKGAVKPANIKYSYRLEWAQQSDHGDSLWDYQTDYVFAEVGAQLRSHSLTLSYEKVGADNNTGFQTPLGSNHKFLGWADIFSGYRSGQGLGDLFVTYKGRDGKLRWRTMLHNFSDESGDTDMGQELDVELAYRYSRKLEFKAAAAFYFADEGFYMLPHSQQDQSMWFVSINYNI